MLLANNQTMPSFVETCKSNAAVLHTSLVGDPRLGVACPENACQNLRDTEMRAVISSKLSNF